MDSEDDLVFVCSRTVKRKTMDPSLAGSKSKAGTIHCMKDTGGESDASVKSETSTVRSGQRTRGHPVSKIVYDTPKSQSMEGAITKPHRKNGQAQSTSPHMTISADSLNHRATPEYRLDNQEPTSISSDESDYELFVRDYDDIEDPNQFEGDTNNLDQHVVDLTDDTTSDEDCDDEVNEHTLMTRPLSTTTKIKRESSLSNETKSEAIQPITDDSDSSPARDKTIKRQRVLLAKTSKEWFARPGHYKKIRNSFSRAVVLKRKRQEEQLGSSGADGFNRPKKHGGPRARGRKSRDEEISSAAMQSLRQSDPFKARIEKGIVSDAVPITATTKTGQFQQMMQNVLEKDKKYSVHDKRSLDLATQSFGLNKCIAKDGKWLVAGMKTLLHNHQVIGTSWMLFREFSQDGSPGGILGDEMGMGKTLQTLALIVSHMPDEEDLVSYKKSTLIVMPAAAISQWENEIKAHVKPQYINAVLHYRESMKLPLVLVAAADVVLVSYSELGLQFPSRNERLLLGISEEDSFEAIEDKWGKPLGNLFKIPWFRVVLDESQNIKNRESQWSIACRRLTCKYPWALSGTPITNSSNELYPYFKFLRTGPFTNFKEFKKRYGNIGDERAMLELGQLVSQIMFKRTMADSFLGRALYDIPLCHEEVRRISLTREERVIYGAVESRFRTLMNRGLEEIRKRRKEIRIQDVKIYIVFLLRLRQGVAHPFLLEPVFKKTLVKEDLLTIQSKLRALGNTPVYEQIRAWCVKQAGPAENSAGGETGLPRTFGRSQFGYELNMDKQLEIALASQQEDVCRICYDEIVDEVEATCKHTFCKLCLKAYIQGEYNDGRVIPKCPECNYSLANLDLSGESESEDSDDDVAVPVKRSLCVTSRQWKKGRDYFRVHPKLSRSNSSFLRQSDRNHGPVVPSAKTTAVKDEVLKWQAEAPDDKIIIFTDFKATGAIIGRMLCAENIKFLYFYGDMSNAAKERAKKAFYDDKELKVMNQSTENQAFARVFRIGQSKETYFLRIITKNTIEIRMEAVQLRKKNNINQVLRASPEQLSVEEFLSLFGRLEINAQGDFELVSEDDEEDDEGEEEGEEEEYDEGEEEGEEEGYDPHEE
ncbi:SNF2 family N-terminal domain-containing protein [Xylariaceae sp. FL1019]|nr:SNF2 family N-terminal domain-containing protein [Xylariaceae sp. FL1019]